MRTGVGIEIGPSMVRAVRMDASGGQPALRAAEEAPWDPSQPDTLSRAMQRLRQALRITEPVTVGLPTTSTLLTTLAPLVVNERRAALAVAFELQQQLPFDLGQAAWHHQWLSMNGQTSGTRAQRSPHAPALVVAMKRSVLDEWLMACRRAGLRVRAAAVNAVAALNACERLGPGSRGPAMALVHATSERSADWVLAGPETVESIPVSTSGDLPLEQALKDSWLALQATHPGLPAAVWVAGEPSIVSARILPALAALNLRPQLIDLGRAGAGRRDDSAASGRWAVASGLALQGCGATRWSLNLLEGARRAETAQSRQRLAVIASAVCAVIVLACSFGSMWQIRQRHAAVVRMLEQRGRLYERLRPDVRSLLQRQERLEGVIHRLEGVAAEADAIARGVAQVAEALPETVWLTRIAWVKRNGTPGAQLEGKAKSYQDLTQLLERLKALPQMGQVKLLSSAVAVDPTSGREQVTFAVVFQQQEAAAE